MRKTPGDAFADVFVHGARKLAAEAASAGLKTLSHSVGGAIGALDRVAACTCAPTEVKAVGPDGEEETILIHGKSCPSR